MKRKRDNGNEKNDGENAKEVQIIKIASLKERRKKNWGKWKEKERTIGEKKSNGMKTGDAKKEKKRKLANRMK